VLFGSGPGPAIRTAGRGAGAAPALPLGWLAPLHVLLLGLAGRQAGDMDGICDRVVRALLSMGADHAVSIPQEADCARIGTSLPHLRLTTRLP